MGADLLPAKPKGLTDEEEEIARLMTYGLPHEEVILGKVVKPDWPLTLEHAAKFVGYRQRPDAPAKDKGTQAALEWLAGQFPDLLRPAACPEPPQPYELSGLKCPAVKASTSK
jgi:hypothetical protein